MRGRVRQLCAENFRASDYFLFTSPVINADLLKKAVTLCARLTIYLRLCMYVYACGELLERDKLYLTILSFATLYGVSGKR